MSEFEQVKPYTQAELDQQAVWANEFDQWWENEGQYHRAGGNDYCRTFAWWAWLNREETQQTKINSLTLKLNGAQFTLNCMARNVQEYKAEIDELTDEFEEDKRFLSEQIKTKDMQIESLKYTQTSDEQLIASQTKRIANLQTQIESQSNILEACAQLAQQWSNLKNDPNASLTDRLTAFNYASELSKVLNK